MKPNPAYSDERWVIEECRRGKHQAQKYIYDMHAESMMIVCLRYVENVEDAREVLLDGFYSFYKNIGQFTWQAEGSVRAWLKKIVVNQCLMHLRKKGKLILSGKEPEEYSELSIQETVLDHLSAKEIMMLVHALPEGYRTVFNLYVFEGKTHKEIAVMLDISESTSKTQLYKARLLLQKKLLLTK